ncbi:MAG: LamG-like jellyroll fold domain-containing protein [Nanoarchaeota archaeon]|nr:hypothetical protein [Nanoarchaeota archaeon]MBU1445557.1 hypothetical protein [Nanoarchaeota archaeon]MBU2475210.1 hypothetical protein [Nanoarchaeota archaeon]
MLFVLIGVFFIHSDFDLVGFAVIDLNETDLTEINESLGFELKESNNFSENLTLEFEEINITSLNETEETINNINASPEIIEKLSQGQAVVGESVKWIKNIKLENPTTGVSVKLPWGSQNIDVKKITGGEKEKIELDEIKMNKGGVQIPIQETNLITGGVVTSFEGNWFLRVFYMVDSWFKSFTSVFGMVVFQEIEHEEFIEIIIEDEVEEVEIEYYTEGPKILEEEINNYKKRINVYSEISYENVSVQISVSELSKEKIKLYELIGGERILVEDISYIDKDSNGLIEEIGWIIPRLDDQTYELEITILNVQSYPVVGGNWAVRFTTIGEADLIVKAVNETTWSNVNELEDLKFLEIKCGEEVLDYSWIDDSVVVYNYSCNETGFEISKVLTSGVHDLEFTFGSQTAYAHNEAGDWHGFKVYHGNFHYSSGTSTYSDIGATVNPDKAFLIVYTAGTSTPSTPTTGAATGYIYNSTSLLFERNASSSGLYISWFVVESLGNEFDVRGRGEITLPATVTSNTSSVSGVSDVGQSMIVYGGHRGNGTSTADWEDVFCNVNLTDSITVTAKRDSGSQGTESIIRYEVVEWNSSYNVYNGEITVSASPTSDLVSGSGNPDDAVINMSRSFVLANWLTPSNGIRQVQTVYYINDTNQLLFRSYLLGYNNLANWYVVESPEGAPFNVQRFSYNWDPSIAAPMKSNNIPTPINTSRSFIRHSMSVSGTGTAFRRDFTLPVLVNGSNWTEMQYNSNDATFDQEEARSSVVELSPVSREDDNIAPQITWVSPTPDDDDTISASAVYLNLTVVDNTTTSAFFDWNYSLIGYWSMDFYNITGVYDNSTYSHHGTMEGDPEQINGKFGNAFSFDGNDSLAVSSTTDLKISGNMTISVWINPNAWTSGWKTVASKGWDDWWLNANADNEFMRCVLINSTGTTHQVLTVNNALSTVNKWYHVLVTHNSSDGNVSLYLDTEIKDSIIMPGGIRTSNNALYIGEHSPNRNQNYWNGSIDELMIFDRVLSTEEILAIYNNTANRLYHNFTGLVDGTTYNYSAYVIDEFGNVNFTSLRGVTIELDATAPNLTLDHPQNITYSYNTSLPLNYTATDGGGLDTVWYNLDNGANTTLTANITFDTSVASHTLYIWANDTTNNINSTSVSFDIDLTHPVITWDSPTPDDDAIISINSVYLNVTVTDASNTSAFFDWNYSLIGYWSMDFYNITGVYDNSSNSNFGGFGNGLSTSNITSGKFGNAIDFDKSGDSFLNCSNNSIFGGMDELTIEAWVKWEGGVDADEDTIVSNWVGSGNRTYYLRWDSETSRLEAFIQNSSGSNFGGGYDNTNISDGDWHHVAFTYDGTDTFIYLDGVKSATAGLNTVFGKLDVASNPVYIGNTPHLPISDSFDGLIDEVRIYSRALTPKEVNASYDNNVYRLENNFTDLSEGFYNYSAYAIDSAGNLNISDYRGVTVNAGCNVTLTSSHTMTDDLTCVNTAFNIGDNNVVLDCAGYDITYATAGTAATYGIDNNGNYDNITIKNCNITEGESGTSTKYGVDFGSTINSTVFNNTINTTGSNAIGIFFDSSAGYNKVLNNTVLTSGGTAHAIHLQTPNTNVTGNVVTTTGASAIGIDVADGCLNNIVYNNTVTTDDTGAWGIRLVAASNNNVSKNTINTTGTDSDAIYIAGNSDGNVIYENTVLVSGGDGIELRKVFANAPNNNNISKNIFNNVNDYDLLVGDATDVTYLIDQTITNYSFFSGGNILYIENSTSGIIRFLTGVNGSGPDLSDDIQILNNSITVKSDSNIGLNRSANLTFYNIDWITTATVKSQREGVDCPSTICGSVTNVSSTYYFNVTSFTKYNISNNNSAPPQVTLSSPGDTTSTTDRTPTFTWNSVVDIDGDSVTYTINVDNDNDFSSCIINVSAIGGTTHTPAADLDIDDIYYWRVRATDGTDYGLWSASWNFSLNSLLSITAPTNLMEFGAVDRGTSYNTTGDSPNPFLVQNDGNALINISINATSSLFDTVSLPDASYQAKVDNKTGEDNSFNWANSVTSWFNVPGVTTLAIASLKYPDATDSAELDILINSPLDELSGSKSSSIDFEATLAE